MAQFTVVRDVRAPAGAVFARLVDWDAHSAAIPLTRLHHTGEAAVGQRFVARTGWGRLAFDDPMEVRVRPLGTASVTWAGWSKWPRPAGSSPAGCAGR